MTATIGDAIKAARKMRDKSQQEVADALGIARPSLTQWERDITHPSVSNLKGLCDFLQISADSLLSGVVTTVDRPSASADDNEADNTLGLVCRAAEREIGFAPSRDQALRWLIKKAGITDAVFKR